MSEINQKKKPYDYGEANEWEAKRTETIEKSERRAWKISGCLVFVAVAQAAAIAMMVPLKETIPYLYRVDKITGAPDLISTMTDKAVTGDEVQDKYWLAQFVRARETYDWYTLQNDYETVGLLSSPNVGKAYAQLFEGKEALDKQYGKSIRATVEIGTVVPNGDGTGTVRFTKTTKRVDQENSPSSVTKWIATVAYEYQSTARIKESARLTNPFGFQALTYRVDPEMIGSGQ